MSWRANDLCSDADLVAYEQDVLKTFGRTEWTDKRQKALNDWLWPLLRSNHFPTERFRTRYVPDAVQQQTSAVFTDLTSAAHSVTADDLNLATIFATVGTDALYIGSTEMFRGLSVRMSDSVSAVTSTMTVSLWTDAWEAVAMTDGTSRTAGKTFSGGGAVTWRVPEGWVTRSVNNSAPLYWAKVTVSATPTGAKGGQIGVIRSSLLCGPVALRTLALIFREAPTKQDGPWMEKAIWYGEEADKAFERAVPSLGGEFDALIQDDQISAPEAAQTTSQVTDGGWSMERG